MAEKPKRATYSNPAHTTKKKNEENMITQQSILQPSPYTPTPKLSHNQTWFVTEAVLL